MRTGNVRSAIAIALHGRYDAICQPRPQGPRGVLRGEFPHPHRGRTSDAGQPWRARVRQFGQHGIHKRSGGIGIGLLRQRPEFTDIQVKRSTQGVTCGCGGRLGVQDNAAVIGARFVPPRTLRPRVYVCGCPIAARVLKGEVVAVFLKCVQGPCIFLFKETLPHMGQGD